MKEIYWAVLFTVCICDVLLVTGDKQCFRYTWPGPGIKPEEKNCTEYKEKLSNIPCINPIISGVKKPNTTEIWENRNNNNETLCRLEDGYACIKYTYIYNSAIMNVSYFCGKVIEDKTKPITSRCFVYYTEGYTIEACACKSNDNAPCNSIRRNTNLILITFTATAVPLFIYKMFNIP